MCLLVAPFPHFSSLAPLKQLCWKHDHIQAAVTKGAQPGTRSWLPALMFTSVSSKPQVFLLRELPLKHSSLETAQARTGTTDPEDWKSIALFLTQSLGQKGVQTHKHSWLPQENVPMLPSLKSLVDWSTPDWNGNCTSGTKGPLWPSFYKQELRHCEDTKSDILQ